MNRYGHNDHLNEEQAKKIVKEVITNNKSGEFYINNIYLDLQRATINLRYIEDPQSIHTNILSRKDEMKCIDEKIK